MTKLTDYTIALGDVSPENLTGIKELFEENASLFEELILSSYGDDSRYSVLLDSFEVTSIADGFISFSCEVNFYAGCSDQDDTFIYEGNTEYQVDGDEITFELDETVWHQE